MGADLGLRYSPAEVESVLDAAGLRADRVDDPAAEASERLLSGQVIGWGGARVGAGLPTDAVWWRNGTAVTLNSLLRPGSGWALDVAFDINDAGTAIAAPVSGFWRTAALAILCPLISHSW